ncbi:N-formyl peptide receptor 2 [Vombatus ursinus]|uniref:G-protein coupled receptors family 1 profile domain-containing protein n=1 Tax=Vombatus ursinus TaxID=29139 RepID=A0A4X2KHS5_VOMUR|nr:N-formyl peptide receptor 2 [Vombatus ursinus]XP_027714027.1 N-formyl peptide receptor 2 [Vombatus ursinus]
MMENSSVLPSDASDALFPTESPPTAIHQAFWIISLIIFCLAFVLGITGNGLVIWVAGFRMARTVTSVLFLNLAAADFTFTAFLPFFIVGTALQPHWPFGWFLCKLISSLAIFNMFASVFLLTLISLDRCVSVLWPVWARNHRTPRRAALGAAGAWTFALAFSVPAFIFRTTDTENGTTFCYIEFDPWDEAGDDDEYYYALSESRQWSLVCSRFFLGFVIPLLIITVCYGLITTKLWSRVKTKSSRPFKILTAVVAAFFLCWLPHHVMGMIEVSVFSHPHFKEVLPYLSPLSSCLVFVNSCLNPLLYAFIGRDFRERLFRSLPAALERALSEESTPTGTTATSSTCAPPATDAETQGL